MVPWTAGRRYDVIVRQPADARGDAAVVKRSDAASADLAGSAQGSAQRAVYFAFAVAMPLTFVGNEFAGFRASGWAWLLNLGAIAPLVLAAPVPVRAVRYLSSYLAFLGLCILSLAWVQDLQTGALTSVQLTVPILAYILAWRISNRSEQVLDQLAQICLLGLGLVAVWLVADHVVGGLPGLELSVRPVAISLAVIFVGATINARSWRRTILVGITVILIAVLTGSRMSAAVLTVMLLCTPSLAVSLKWRVVVAVLAVLLLLGLSQTEEFKARFFFATDATLTDVLTLSPKLDTSGRREAWPQLIKTCSHAPITGLGIGATYRLSQEISGGALTQPHNDYLRTYCETGWPGFIAFWGFFLAAGVRSVRLAVRGADRQLHAAAGLLVLSFILFALSDNPMVYTAHFMTPLAIILGLSDGTYHRKRVHHLSHAATEAPWARASAGAEALLLRGQR
jgi:O-antigen ligase